MSNLIRESESNHIHWRDESESLRLITKALQRDKTLLNLELALVKNKLNEITKLIERGENVRYCKACGTYYASGTKCDCTAGLDYDYDYDANDDAYQG